MDQVATIPLGYNLDRILTELSRVRDYYAQFPFIRRTAIAIGQPSTDNDLGRILRNTVKFVRDRILYVPDPYGFELVVAPDVLLAEILKAGHAHGDCDDHVLLLNTLLCSVGFQTSFVAVKQESTEFNHVIAGVYLDGQWIDVDPCDKGNNNVTYDEKYIVY